MMLGTSFSRPEKYYMYYKETMRQMNDIGIGSLVIVGLIAIFIGAVTAVQFLYQLDGTLVPVYYIGYIIRDSTIIELAPTITCLVLAGKVGSNMAAEIGGQNREMEVSFQSLQFAVLLAIFLVYLVMASTFESLIHPFIVLLTIPLALIGVVAGLLATDTTVTVIVLIGAVMLGGIVVNNAIVLIDTINRFRRDGIEKVEAVVRAGHVRLRPILMTTLTTTLALVPMAMGFGEGGELRAPLAITVGSGLVLSTLLTLVVIPAVYVIVPSKVEALEEDA